MKGLVRRCSWSRTLALTGALHAGLLSAVPVTAQETPSAASVRAFFDRLATSGDGSPQPGGADEGTIHQHLETMVVEDVRAVLPSIVRAMAVADEGARGHAAFAAFVVSLRPDGRALLAPFTMPLARLLGAQTERVRYLAYVALSNAADARSREWLEPLVETLRDRARSGSERLHALAAALTLAPGEPVAEDAAEAYFYEPLEVETQASALQLLAQSAVTSARFRAVTLLALESSYPRVKLAAIDVIRRMGGDAVADAETRLRAIAERATEQPDVRRAAEGALRGK
jgi:hypothetical protein